MDKHILELPISSSGDSGPTPSKGNNGRQPEAPKNQWPDPILFDEFQIKEIPSSILPEPYREYSSALSRAMEIPSAMTVAGIFGIVSAASSHRFYVSPKPGWSEPINVYLAVAIDPGNLKSPTLKKLLQPAIEWEVGQAEDLGPEIKRAISERKTKEKVIDRLRAKAAGQKDPDLLKHDTREIADLEAELEDPPVLPKVFVTDTTPEQLATNTFEQGGKFAVISDEGGIMKVIAGLYSGGNANIDIILKGIDGGPVRIRRKDRSIDLNPFLTFCLFCQPSVIENMGREAAFDGNGLVERFMYLLPESRLGYRSHKNEPLGDSIHLEYNSRIKSLLNEYMAPHEINSPRYTLKPDERAFKEWRSYQDHIETQLRPGGKLAAIPGWGGKVCGYALRIAGLLQVMECGHHNPSISLDVMDRALSFSALLTEHTLAGFYSMGVNKVGTKANAVFNWIIRNGQPRFQKRVCLKALRTQLKNVKELEDILLDFERRNIVSSPIELETGGRPSISYEVNPGLLQEVD